MKKLTSLVLSVALMLTLVVGCSSSTTQDDTADLATATPEPTVQAEVTATPEPTAEPTATPDVTADMEPVTLGLLSGPTGMGAAKLWADSDAGESTLTYDIFLGADPATEIVPKLITGELDVAALSTNLAATLYHKTEGGIQLLALNTLGVLRILENGQEIQSMADLQGKTIYATGQGSNPEYVLNYLLEQNGLTPGVDVTIEWLASEEVVTLMVTGQIDLCMLPVPAATTVTIKNPDVRSAIDLNDVWEDAGITGTLTMGCLVATTQWIEENPDLVPLLIEEYEASINYVLENQEEAAQFIAQYGITASAEIAQAAIPEGNLVCITGRDMRDIQNYYEVLFAADPTSIGGSIPDDAIYYLGQ